MKWFTLKMIWKITMAEKNVICHPVAFERTDLTPEQALGTAQRYDWDKVIICGYAKGDSDLKVRTSHMSRADALWLVEHLKKHVLGDL